MVTHDEWNAWLQDPVTIAVFAMLHKQREAIKEMWATHGFIRDTAEQTALESSRALGGVDMLDDIINIEIGDLNG